VEVVQDGTVVRMAHGGTPVDGDIVSFTITFTQSEVGPATSQSKHAEVP
jgi:hypothetical protein